MAELEGSEVELTRSNIDLGPMELRAAAASGDRWEFVRDGTGEPAIRIVFGDGDRQEMRVTRDNQRASEADVRFIAAARSDIEKLTMAIRRTNALAHEELNAIETRVAGASPGEWTAFLEEDGGLAGCDVIRISDDDDEPDLYLWIGSNLAPAGDFRFVAAARQDIPALIDFVRRDQAQSSR